MYYTFFYFCLCNNREMYKGIAFLVKLVICFNLIGQEIKVFDFNHLSVENGMSNNFVKTIFKDRLGYYWFGTLEGINRYDGQEIKTFKNYLPKGVNSVNAIAEDDERLLIGTERGLYFWDRISDSFTRSDKNKNFNVLKIQKINGQEFVVLTADDCLFYNSHSDTFIKLKFHKEVLNLLEGSRVVDFHIEGDQLFLIAGELIIQYDLNNHSSFFYDLTYNNKATQLRFTSIAKSDNYIYLGTLAHGVFEFNVNNKNFTSVKGLENFIILTLKVSDEILYVGTDSDGLYIYDRNKSLLTQIEHDNARPASISSNAIYSISIDDNGYLWTGSYAGGVSYTSLDESSFNVFNGTNELSLINKSIRSFLFEDATKYIGTRDGLYIVENNGDAKYFDRNNSVLTANIILSIYKENNNVLIGTYGGGIYQLNKTTKELVKWIDPVFNNQSVYGFVKDKEQKLWIATLNGLYRIADDGSVIHYSSKNSEINNELIYAVNIDANHRLWIGTSEGFQIFDIKEDSLKTVYESGDSINSKTNAFYNDSNGRTWVCIEHNGVYIYNSNYEIVYHLNEENGLCDNSATSVCVTHSGEAWLGTLKGLTHFIEESKSTNSYYISNGLPGLVFNPNACLVDKDEFIWMGNEKGLIYFNPELLKNDDDTKNILITDILVGGKSIREVYSDEINTPIEELNHLQFRGRDNSLGFKFINLQIPNITENQYSVKLTKYKDAEGEWMELGRENSVFYNSLKPGNYQLYIALNDGQGKVQEEHFKIFTFKIGHEWYQSVFTLVIIIVVILVMLAVLIYFIRDNKRKLQFIKEVKTDTEKDKYESSSMDQTRSKVLLKEIEDYVVNSKVYLNPDLKLRHLSDELNYSIHDISQAINQNMNQGFTDFINYFRVQEVIIHLNDSSYSKFTLMAIAEKCGFNSKSSFYRAFKKVTGNTPSDYWMSLQKKDN